MTTKQKLEAVNSDQAKYQQIVTSIKERILSGDYTGGQRLPSEAALVKRFGVSRPTAARALRELAQVGLVERKAGAGSFVVENPLRVSGQRQLGLLIPQWESTEIFEMICGQLAGLARMKGFAVQWSSARGRWNGLDGEGGGDAAEAAIIKQAEHLCTEFIESRVDGVFFAPLELSQRHAEVNHRIGERFRLAGIPVVLVDRDMEVFPRRGIFDVVGIENVEAGFLLAEHLLRLGCRRIVFFSRPFSAATVPARVMGVREALLQNGLALDTDAVIEGNPSDTAFVKASLLKKKYDACICSNDRMAAQLLQCLFKLGVRVPHDLRIVGFDDVKYATLMTVPLTTIHQPCDEIAALALDAMLRRLDNPLAPVCHISASPRLVVRESCGTYLPR